ncbi:MAG TPA: 3-phosphoshikimate 1-carboxyvinyltransferase [Thiobacillaceae bacterium]|nr:3-phosphoshikimate 1-carboxyvinyltransferase [Thiobacillaceae bacterium]
MIKAYLDLQPAKGARGTIRLPGSKSISNRVLLLSALADGTTEVKDLLDSDDTRVMLDALCALGAGVERRFDSGDYAISGVGGAFPVKHAELFLGNAGTAFRSLTAACALSGGEYQLSGVPRMHERPIGDLVDALRQLGAQVDYLGKEGFPPLAIRPCQTTRAPEVSVKGIVSSQYLTGLLLSAPLLGREVSIRVEGELISKPYIGITLGLMERYGVKVQRENWQRFIVPAASYKSPGTIHVEGDASSASYFLAAGALGHGPVRVEGVGRSSLQGDVQFAAALARMGAEVSFGPNWIESRLGCADRLHALELDCNHIPDAAMTLAVLALFADGTTSLTHIGSWRVKETDRIAAMATELRKFGATVEEGADFIRVTPPSPSLLTPHVAVDTYDDHRMAMCFSLVALGGVSVRINDPACVNKTYPDYFHAFSSLLS